MYSHNSNARSFFQFFQIFFPFFFLKPQEGEQVLDMCASPGGKTTHIATLMKNHGRVISIDKTPQKVEKIKQLCVQMGITCVSALCLDSTRILNKELPPNLFSNSASAFPPESFDKVLLDPPCSGLGQRPRLEDLTSLVTLKSYAPYQRKLFHVAVSLLKVGGTLVYSTCTINPEENEEMVRFALDSFPLQLEPQVPHVGQKGLLFAVPSPKSLSEKEAELVQRFDPAVSNTIGFFIAKFTKKASYIQKD
jgi:16S rRNA C967 or C1407 C5-methylase (RsmB/RsmF family)